LQPLTAVLTFFWLTGLAPWQHFFPTRPAHVPKMYVARGTLLDYGAGNDTGGLAIRDDKGRVVPFVLAFPHTIDGKHYTCNNAPEPGKARDYRNCPEWPSYVVLRKTRVLVTYWWQHAPSGQLVKVSDSITRDRH